MSKPNTLIDENLDRSRHNALSFILISYLLHGNHVKNEQKSQYEAVREKLFLEFQKNFLSLTKEQKQEFCKMGASVDQNEAKTDIVSDESLRQKVNECFLACRGNNFLQIAIKFNIQNFFETLIGSFDLADEEEKKSVASHRDRDGNTLLHLAVLSKDMIVAQSLITTFGEYFNSKEANSRNETAIYLAVINCIKSRFDPNNRQEISKTLSILSGLLVSDHNASDAFNCLVSKFPSFFSRETNSYFQCDITESDIPKTIHVNESNMLREMLLFTESISNLSGGGDIFEVKGDESDSIRALKPKMQEVIKSSIIKNERLLTLLFLFQICGKLPDKYKEFGFGSLLITASNIFFDLKHSHKGVDYLSAGLIDSFIEFYGLKEHLKDTKMYKELQTILGEVDQAIGAQKSQDQLKKEQDDKDLQEKEEIQKLLEEREVERELKRKKIEESKQIEDLPRLIMIFLNRGKNLKEEKDDSLEQEKTKIIDLIKKSIERDKKKRLGNNQAVEVANNDLSKYFDEYLSKNYESIILGDYFSPLFELCHAAGVFRDGVAQLRHNAINLFYNDLSGEIERLRFVNDTVGISKFLNNFIAIEESAQSFNSNALEGLFTLVANHAKISADKKIPLLQKLISHEVNHEVNQGHIHCLYDLIKRESESKSPEVVKKNPYEDKKNMAPKFINYFQIKYMSEVGLQKKDGRSRAIKNDKENKYKEEYSDYIKCLIAVGDSIEVMREVEALKSEMNKSEDKKAAEDDLKMIGAILKNKVNGLCSSSDPILGLLSGFEITSERQKKSYHLFNAICQIEQENWEFAAYHIASMLGMDETKSGAQIGNFFESLAEKLPDNFDDKIFPILQCGIKCCARAGIPIVEVTMALAGEFEDRKSQPQKTTQEDNENVAPANPVLNQYPNAVQVSTIGNGVYAVIENEEHKAQFQSVLDNSSCRGFASATGDQGVKKLIGNFQKDEKSINLYELKILGANGAGDLRLIGHEKKIGDKTVIVFDSRVLDHQEINNDRVINAYIAGLPVVVALTSATQLSSHGKSQNKS